MNENNELKERDMGDIQPSVKELRDKGWRVRVTHWRVVQFSRQFLLVQKDKLPFIKDFVYESSGGRFNNDDFIIESRGGKTRVELISPRGDKLVGESVCSLKDNFNRREGVIYALNRALRHYHVDV